MCFSIIDVHLRSSSNVLFIPRFVVDVHHSLLGSTVCFKHFILILPSFSVVRQLYSKHSPLLFMSHFFSRMIVEEANQFSYRTKDTTRQPYDFMFFQQEMYSKQKVTWTQWQSQRDGNTWDVTVILETHDSQEKRRCVFSRVDSLCLVWKSSFLSPSLSEVSRVASRVSFVFIVPRSKREEPNVSEKEESRREKDSVTESWGRRMTSSDFCFFLLFWRRSERWEDNMKKWRDRTKVAKRDFSFFVTNWCPSCSFLSCLVDDSILLLK